MVVLLARDGAIEPRDDGIAEGTVQVQMQFYFWQALHPGNFMRCGKDRESEYSLAGASYGGRSGPIGRNEIDAPEMRRRSEELDADALALLGGIAEKHDAAFLLFLREGVGENHDGVDRERLVQVHQSAVRVDDDGLASFAEAPVVGVLSRDHHAHAHEDPCTAPNLVEIRFGHGKTMLPHIGVGVNRGVAQVFPYCKLGFLLFPFAWQPLLSLRWYRRNAL